MKYIVIKTDCCIFAADIVTKPETLEDILRKEIRKIPSGINARGEMISSLILERFMLQVSKEDVPEAIELFKAWKRGYVI